MPDRVPLAPVQLTVHSIICSFSNMAPTLSQLETGTAAAMQQFWRYTGFAA
jgi:hypothetical protein